MTMPAILRAGACLLAAFATLSAASIPEARRTDWSHAGVAGGIPAWTTIIDATTHGVDATGQADATSHLQALLTAHAGQDAVVYLPAGTYRIDGTLVFPQAGRIVLRGAGGGLTKLRCGVGAIGHGAVLDITAGTDAGPSRPVTDGALLGSTVIQMADTTGFAVGDLLLVDQENDLALMSTSNPTFWNDGAWAARSVGEHVPVIAVASGSVTIERPLRYTYNTALDVRATPIRPIRRVGIENLAIELTQPGDKYTVHLMRAMDCWIAGVHSTKTVRAHVSINRSHGITVRDGSCIDSWDHGENGHGYGVDCNSRTTDCLIENNVFRRLRHSMLTHLGASGNVFAYNHSREGTWTLDPDVPPDISIHGHFSFMNLFEGNVVEEIAMTDYWGPAGSGNTCFRNRVTKSRLTVYDRSIEQNAVGNDIAAGTIWVDGKAIRTLVHGNYVKGVLSWAAGNGTNNLEDSLFRAAAPAWWIGAWPAIGWPRAAGTGMIPAQARWNAGNPPVTYPDPTFPTAQRTPFDQPIPVPGTIEAEAFDRGGPGLAVNDTTTANQNSTTYRPDETVDCWKGANGGGVGYTSAGEWLLYTVDVAAAGSYAVTARAAVNGTGAAMTVSIDGGASLGSVALPNNGSYTTYQNVALGTLAMPAGLQTLRIAIGKGGFNLDHLSLSPTTTTPVTAARVIVDPYQGGDGTLYDFFQLRVANQSTSAGLSRIEILVAGGGVFDCCGAAGPFTAPASLGGNGDGNTTTTLVLTASTPLAAGATANNGFRDYRSDLDGVVTGLTVRATFTDGAVVEAPMINIGDSDDGDADCWHVDLTAPAASSGPG
jgi:hypothetical protein